MRTGEPLVYLLNSHLFFLSVELIGIGLAIGTAIAGLSARWIQSIEAGFAKVAQHRAIALLVPFTIVCLVRVLLLNIFPVPVPGVHDEFSYLLNADTFAHLRLVNTTHAMWPFFESFHILQRPTYVSMYPAAQGLVLGFGQLLGSAWIGVLLSTAGMCSAITWALQGWVANEWALLGGVVSALRLGIVSYWIDSYWGGSVAALGGALMLGATARLIVQPGVRSGLILAIGMLILLNSRPYEGCAFLIGCLVLILSSNLRTFRAGSVALAKALWPAFVLFLGGLSAMSFYFWRTTGSPVLMPYVLQSRTYAIVPPFLWNSLSPAHFYDHPVMQAYYDHQIPLFWRSHTAVGWIAETARKLTSIAMFYFWPGILVVMLTLARLLKSEAGRAALFLIAIVTAALSFEIWPMMLHYPAPMTAATTLLLVCALRESREVKIGRWAVGRNILRMFMITCLLALGLRIGAALTRVQVPDHGLVPWLTAADGNMSLQRITEYLKAIPGKHLVIVRYSPSHDLSQEWVYNSASIDDSPVVWAREMGRGRTSNLIRYFSDRHVWLLEPDRKPLVLKPYTD